MDTEETIETTEEEVLDEPKPLEDESPQEDKDSSDKTPSEEKNKRLYARMKKAEEEVKALKDSIGKKEDKGDSPVSQEKDVFDLAKTVASLRDFSPEELDFIQMMSKSKSISPEEAAQTEEAKLYIAARRQKVEDEKSKLEPSTKQSPTEKSVNDVTPQDLKNMSVTEKEAFLEKLGWGNKPFKRND